MTSPILIGLSILCLGILLLNLGLKIVKFGFKYLIMFAFVGGFGYSACHNIFPDKTMEETTKGLEIHQCEITRVTKFSTTKVNIVLNQKEFSIEGKCDLWKPHLVGVAQDEKYIFLLVKEPFKDEHHAYQNPD